MENYRKIDLVLWAKKAWLDRNQIFLVVVTFICLGVFIAIFSPRIYSARSVFIPQSSESAKSSGSLGGLASMAGINLGNMQNSSEVPPALYPQFLSSSDFKMKLLKIPITIPGTSSRVTYQEFFEIHYQPGILELIRKYTLGLPSEIIKLFQKKPVVLVQTESEIPTFLQLSILEFEHFKRLDAQLSVQNKEEEGVVELVFSMPDPLMAAEMAQASETLLQQEIINYKIQNAIVQLEFTQERFEEKKKEFEETQEKLAIFRERNQNIISAGLLNYQEKLEAEYDFSFNIYNELAKQLEQAKLQVAKDTPVFAVIQKVTIPVQKSSPNRPLIFVIFILLGIVISLAISLTKEIFHHLKEDWNEI